MRLREASLALAFFFVTSVAPADTPNRSCVKVEVSSDSAGSPAPRRAGMPRAPLFSATKILDLTFTVLLPARTEGEHLVELRVFTPDDQLYRSLAVPVASHERPGASRSVKGYARPLPEQPLVQVVRGKGHFAAASTTLPVAGTDIVSAGLYGRWRVEAYLDEAEERCAPAAWFTLRP
jgi:hypothetical protein